MTRAEQLAQLTTDLVSIPSVNERRMLGERTPYEETLFADKLYRWFLDRGINTIRQELPDGRKNVFAFVPGASNQTVVLSGHFDTVGVEDYQRRGMHPFDPEKLAQEQPVFGNDFIQGRGAFDMKSGIAVGMTMMEEWKRSEEMLPGSVLFVATCDEENNSRGILSAGEVLLRAKGEIRDDSELQHAVTELTEGQMLDLQGIINLDYTTQRYPGDKEYHLWAGTIGKLLPSIYIRGKETHAGEHFNGFHATTVLARIVRAVDGNMAFADGNVPPTTLRMTDNRTAYDVMTASTGMAYFNVFTVGRTPTQIMEQMHKEVVSELQRYSYSADTNYAEYCERMGIPYRVKNLEAQADVLRYSDLVARAEEVFGSDAVSAIIREVTAEGHQDPREAGFAVVDRLVNELRLDRPTVVLFFSPPFYPYIRPQQGRLTEVTDEVVREVGERHEVTITRHDFYPYISDMSYLKIEPEIAAALDGLTAEMPVWGNGYEIDLDVISKLNLPVINVGPYGFGAHQTDERVEKKYTFEILPEIIDQMVRRFLAA